MTQHTQEQGKVRRWTMIGSTHIGDTPLIGGPEVEPDQEVEVWEAAPFRALLRDLNAMQEHYSRERAFLDEQREHAPLVGDLTLGDRLGKWAVCTEVATRLAEILRRLDLQEGSE